MGIDFRNYKEFLPQNVYIGSFRTEIISLVIILFIYDIFQTPLYK